jgi:hypothetical protein
MKTWVNRIICRIFKRHTLEKMTVDGCKFHQFYDRERGGVMTVCKRCNTGVFIPRAK